MGRLAPPVLGATAGALLAGALWTAAMPLGVAGTLCVVAVHAVLGAGLGALLALAPWPWARRATSGLVAALLLAGALPASIAWLGGAQEPPTSPRARHYPVTPVARSAAPAKRLAVIGLDGADWSVIDPLLAAGELPHLADLVARGRTAVLRSIEPIHSPVVWSSIFSGRTPTEHGITGWSSSHSGNRRAALLWEMAGAAGLTSVVVNVPGTWPPTEVRGALVSGFPIPGALVHAGRDRRLAQSIGLLVTEGEHPGPLETARAERDAHGTLRARVPLGSWLAPPTGALRHFAIDAAIRHGWLPLPEVSLALATPGGDEDVVSWTVDGRPFALSRDAWSPWIEIASPAGPLHVRLRRLHDGSLFVTPAFQDPRAPIHPYTSSAAVRDAVAAEGLYVVEPAGWKSADDPAVRDAVFEHLVDVEEMHLRASLALRAQDPEWSVFVHVVTLPDRVSHAFWRFHRPEDYPPVPAEELAANRDKVANAYRESDRLLGRLLAALGPDTAVIVLSDHGFTSVGDRHGDHRLEGMLIAAGPGIAAGDERLTLSVYDVTPLALALLGLPIAEDFAGEPPGEILAGGASPPRRIASYESGDAAPVPDVTIDSSTEEQLRGLGYIE